MYTFAYLGMPQIVIILVIALLIFGPQKVPELARQIGSALRDLKKMSSDVQSAFDLDDHSSYDRYEPPTYEYTPPVSTAYDHGPMDQYGLPATEEHPAIEAAEPEVALSEPDAVVPSLSPTVEEATAAVTDEVVATATRETETTKDVISADAEAKSA